MNMSASGPKSTRSASDGSIFSLIKLSSCGTTSAQYSPVFTRKHSGASPPAGTLYVTLLEFVPLYPPPVDEVPVGVVPLYLPPVEVPVGVGPVAAVEEEIFIIGMLPMVLVMVD